MALEDVIKEVLAQAQKESERIVEEGNKEAETILSGAKKDIKRRQETFVKETDALVEDTKRAHVSNIGLKTNKMLLEAKKEVIDELFGRLVEKLKKMSPRERSVIIDKLLDKAAKEVDAAFVYANEDDSELLPRRLKFGGAIGTAGGIIVESRNKEVRVNYTFETFVEKLKEMYLGEVAKRLF